MQKLYTNNDIQKMMDHVNSNDTLRKQIISHVHENDGGAVSAVLADGYVERFDRYDSAVCENFIVAYEKVTGC